jgi:hypothetical protein
MAPGMKAHEMALVLVVDVAILIVLGALLWGAVAIYHRLGVIIYLLSVVR